VAHVTDLARESVRTTVDGGQPIPLRRHYNEMPSYLRSKEIGRAIIPVEVERGVAWPTPAVPDVRLTGSESDFDSGRPSILTF
jgi:hypothetical protein